MAPLDTAGWAHNGNGEIVNGQTRSRGNDAYFKHAQELQGGDVWRTRVEDEEGGSPEIGFAAEQYNVEKHGETEDSTARVYLGNGSTRIYSGISQDGQDYYHPGHLEDHIPKTEPYDLALRCEAVSNVPQIQFNDNDVWHDFAPGRVALKAGPWFPYLRLFAAVRLSDHSVHRPRAVKSAGKIHKAPAAMAATAAAADGAGAAKKVRSD